MKKTRQVKISVNLLIRAPKVSVPRGAIQTRGGEGRWGGGELGGRQGRVVTCDKYKLRPRSTGVTSPVLLFTKKIFYNAISPKDDVDSRQCLRYIMYFWQTMR